MKIQIVKDAPLKYLIVDEFIPKQLADAMIEEVVRLRPVMQEGKMRIQEKGKFVKEYVDDSKKNLDHLVGTFGQACAAHISEAQDILFELGKEALAENAEWLLIHQARPLEFPMAG